MNKKIKKTDLGLTVIIVVGIIVMVNFFSYNFFTRWDLTENKDYSISKVSREAVSELDDILKIKVYFTKDLPSQYLTLRQDVGDIMEEYRAYSGGRVELEYIDPESLDDPERELYLMGIPPVQFNVFEKDKRQTIKGYLGILVEYKDKREVIPVVQSSYNFEYKMTLAIKKVADEIVATVGVLAGNGSLDMDQNMRTASLRLSEVYDVKTVDLKKEAVIDEAIDTLIIPGPKEEFSEEAQKAIDAFVMRGGALVALIDGVVLDERMQASKNEIGLNKLFDAYGIKVDNNLVMDVNHGNAKFSSGLFSFSTPYPLWPKVVKSGFNQDDPTVSNLEEIVLPWAGSISVDDSIVNDSTGVVSYLARTTDQAAAQIDNFVVDPQQSPQGNEAGPFNLAVSYEGKLNSAFGDEGEASTEAGKIVLVGDSDFINDRFVGESADNLVFFQNIVDSASLDDDLIEIRSKSVTSRPIDELNDKDKVFIRYANVFGMTIVIISFGLIRYYLRRKKKMS